ncbi:phosphatidylethanolamine-binding protein [Phakopsora pachyrhizi]|uniref:Phosphatidylethanolamine-binding protein n=1 Tax=Phakopsora pachyrhizi TaxID=170000 RepID=A0AAV0AWL5_PHAPC|nr:phosphatidylethanolamine-binding protein [Phakopsora pachyrhizi]
MNIYLLLKFSIGLILSSTDLVICQAPTAADLQSVKDAFAKEGVVKDVITNFEPKAVMRVFYAPETEASKVVIPGQKVLRELTAKQPKFLVDFPSETDVSAATKSTFTLIMVDPDAPSRKNPTLGGFRHFLATNVNLNPVNQSTTLEAIISSPPISTYAQPSPPKGTGFHRYVFLLYSGQPSEASLKPFQGAKASRTQFNAQNFVDSSGLVGSPIAGTFMQVTAQ